MTGGAADFRAWATLAAVLLAVLWWVPRVQVRHLKGAAGVDAAARFTAENEARVTLAQILGGIFLVIGAYHAWLQLEETRRNLDITERSQAENLKLTEQGQITTRFGSAVDQLGSDKLEVRLGGIYALEQIARASEPEHWAVMDVLTACVRESAPWPTAERRAGEAKRNRPAIQAMLTVLGRRNLAPEGGKQHWWDLHGTDLEGVLLPEAQLGLFNLSGARLKGADLGIAVLAHSDLRGANLEGADLGGAHMEWANIERASLQCAVLRRTDLSSARAKESNLRGVQIGQTTVLAKAQFVSADLSGAHLEAVDLTDVTLDGADLRGASLLGVRNWKGIKSMKLANVHGVKDAPDGFVEWAVQTMGAVRLPSDAEWAAVRAAGGQTGRPVKGEGDWPCPKTQPAAN